MRFTRLVSVRNVLCAAVLVCGLLGCRPNCVSGFAADEDGICRAVRPCPTGHERRTDLACHAVSSSESEAQQTDEDDAEPNPNLDDTGTAPPAEEGGSHSGSGRIFIQYEGLENYSMHGFVVMGRKPGDLDPSSAFCQVILDQSVDILGEMRPFDGVSDPCPSQGDAVLYEPGEIILQMSLSSGASDSPALCDERTVRVEGDIIADFGGVTSCQE